MMNCKECGKEIKNPCVNQIFCNINCFEEYQTKYGFQYLKAGNIKNERKNK